MSRSSLSDFSKKSIHLWRKPAENLKRNTYHINLYKATGIILTAVFIFLFDQGQSQDVNADFYSPTEETHPSISIDGRLFYGFINNYHNELKIFNAHVPAFEINLSRSTFQKKGWEALYHYPSIGLSFFYTPFNNSETLGHAIGLYPHINFPLLNSSNQNIMFRIGMGMAYFNRKFHPTENYQNLAIGSSLNAMIHFMFDYRVQLNKKNSLLLGLGLIHFSNGSITTPNYGLNLPMVSVAFSHAFKEEPQIQNATTYPLFHYEKNNDLRLDIQTGYGIKEQNSIPSKVFQVFTQSLSLYKPLNKKSSIGIGFDFSWDESHKNMLLEQGIEPATGLGLAKYGSALNYELRLEKFALKFGLGTYLYTKEKTEGPIYEKLALNYLVSKNLYCSIELKAHAIRAAYIAWGIGYQLKFNTKKQ